MAVAVVPCVHNVPFIDYLYSECCSCVDMCPKPNITIHELSKKSHVEDLVANSPQLFQVNNGKDFYINRATALKKVSKNLAHSFSDNKTCS